VPYLSFKFGAIVPQASIGWLAVNADERRVARTIHIVVLGAGRRTGKGG